MSSGNADGAALGYAATSDWVVDSNAGAGGSGCNSAGVDAAAHARRYDGETDADDVADDSVGANRRGARAGIRDAAGAGGTSSC